MRGLTPEKIAAACGGQLIAPDDVKGTEVTDVVIDSRKVSPGCLFVPIKGARVDGHDFIPQVMEAGALITLSERKGEDQSFPCIVVDSTEKALLDIAGLYREILDIPVIGITGSVGKTSTKEMIAAVLGTGFKVHKTAGNFNNNIGLPLTIFGIEDDDEAAVIEMGINHFGEMEALARAARPDIMVITNIGTCHLEFLGDRDGVLKAKTECFPFIRSGGMAVLNGDDDKLAGVDEVNGKRPLFYGTDPACRVYAENIIPLGLRGTRCRINIDDESFDVKIPLPGQHMVMNALAGAAVGALMGLTADEIREGIESPKSISGRLNLIENDGLMIIDDCYNANPMSMKASLDVLKDAGTYTVAILGDMGELGADEKALHYEVGEHAGGCAIDRYITVGSLTEEIDRGIRDARADADITHFSSVDELLEELPAIRKRGGTVLVKASHFMGFERVVEALRQ